MTIRNRFSPQVKVTSQPEGQSLTQQHFAEGADLNNIMASHLKKRIPGVPPQPIGDPKATRQISYGYQAALDYHAAMNLVVSARSKFESLPSKIRSMFGNDVGAMLDFADNPDNRADALALGLVTPTHEEAAAKTKAALRAATEATIAELRAALQGAPGGSTEAGNPNKADPEAQPSYGTNPEGLMKPRRGAPPSGG